MTSPIDRLTTALTERLHYENVGNDSTIVRTDDLAAVLAVVEAAQEAWRVLASDGLPADYYQEAGLALGAALAAIDSIRKP